MQSIYVGNLSHDASETDLRKLFSPHGEVVSARIIKDRFTERSRGFAFVEMSEESADSAIKDLNGTTFMSRAIEVKIARPREDNGGGGGGGNRGGGGNSGGGRETRNRW